MAFGRYGFDMSKFSNQGHDVALGIRERYLWELLAPGTDPIYDNCPDNFAPNCTTNSCRRSIRLHLPR